MNGKLKKISSELIKKNLKLENTLENLERTAKRIPMRVNPAGAHLAIVNPLASIRGGGIMSLFRTHPPTEERVARLREQASRETA